MRKQRRPRIVLASRSAGRAALLLAAGYRFRQIPADIKEPKAPRGAHLERYVLGLAALKARAVAARHPRAIVVGADTALILGRSVVGKPASLHEAALMLRRLGGRTHRISSAACVIFPAPRGTARRREVTLVDTAFVKLRHWPDASIRRFAALTRPLAWAGAYAVQDPLSSAIVENIRGDLATVIGLPIRQLQRILPRPPPKKTSAAKA